MKLSIIIPMFQAENYIERLIQVLGKQIEGNDTEVIFVDDNSTDSTMSRCAEICDIFLPCAKVLRNEKGKGVSGARNTGIMEARGEYITFIDADDLVKDSYWQTIVQAIDDEKDSEEPSDIILCGYQNVDAQGIIMSEIKPGEDKSYHIYEYMLDEFPRNYEEWLINPCWNKLYRRDFLLDNDILFPQDASMGEDLTFSLRGLEKASKVRTVKQTAYLHVEHDGDRLTKGFRRDKLQTQICNYEIIKSLQNQYQFEGLGEIALRFYDDVQSYLDDLYYVSDLNNRDAYRVLRKVAVDEIVRQALVDIKDSNIEDWKYTYLLHGEIGNLHLHMLCRKWKGKISKWIHRNRMSAGLKN